ncbi:transcriptional activator NhaR [Polaromonas sp. YR568]|uniref:transcriptional activator NhaR n=1 Tax=Polaromonas sp. YR568 TaxID=1855301 RepID=UPI003137EBA6
MNYKHLHYFWTVVHTGSIARASEQLHLTPQTLSSQIKQLEARMGQSLLRKAGRGLEPTEAGRLVMQYADGIFALGGELEVALRSGKDGRQTPLFRVGITDSVPKSVAYRVVEPGIRSEPLPRLTCTQGKLSSLLAELAVHRLDLVISEVPVPANLSVRLFSHALGQTSVSFFVSPALLKKGGLLLRDARKRFPASLQTLPLLLPGAESALRGRLEGWLVSHGLAPQVSGEFNDSALMKHFGREGLGVFAAPTVLEAEICHQYGVVSMGAAPDLREEFYAISIERRIRHPAIAAITAFARNELFH